MSLRKFKKDQFYFLSKFSYTPGSQNFEINLKLNRPVSENDKIYELSVIVVDRAHYSSDMDACQLKDIAEITHKVEINENGTPAEENYTFSIPTLFKKHFMLFYLVDCDKNLEDIPDNRNRIEGSVTTKTADDSHFEDSHKNIFAFNILFGMIFLP